MILWDLTSPSSAIYPLSRKWQYFCKGKCNHQVNSPCIQCSQCSVSPCPVHRNGCSDNPPPLEHGYQTTLKAPISVACRLQLPSVCESAEPPCLRVYYPVEYFLVRISMVRSVRTLYVSFSHSCIIDLPFCSTALPMRHGIASVMDLCFCTFASATSLRSRTTYYYAARMPDGIVENVMK